MKYLLLITQLVLCFSTNAQVGIGTTTPNASAQLDVSSTTRGFLPPRMTEAQRNAIVTPAQGLIVYCTDCGTNYSGEPQYFNGTAWVNMIGGPASTPPPSSSICGQVWTITNLNVDRYRNGDIIPKVTDDAIWASLTTGAWCWYNNDSATYASTYGKLYNWYAVNDPRGLAPVGWHIPTDAEWTTLVNCLGGGLVAGGSLKETGTLHWLSPNAGATNSSGFTALPGGRRRPNDGLFVDINGFGFYWSSTETSPGSNNSYNYYLQYNQPYATRDNNGKRIAFSVRCVRD